LLDLLIDKLERKAAVLVLVSKPISLFGIDLSSARRRQIKQTVQAAITADEDRFSSSYRISFESVTILAYFVTGRAMETMFVSEIQPGECWVRPQTAN